jgi:hypothetical protein
MTTGQRDQCIAFAGICQSAALVHRTAHGLATSSREIEPLIDSIFATEPETIDDVYGSVARLRSGIAVGCQNRTPNSRLSCAMSWRCSTSKGDCDTGRRSHICSETASINCGRQARPVMSRCSRRCRVCINAPSALSIAASTSRDLRNICSGQKSLRRSARCCSPEFAVRGFGINPAGVAGTCC